MCKTVQLAIAYSLFQEEETPMHSVWKLLKMSYLNFRILAFSSNFCRFKTDMSGDRWNCLTASFRFSKTRQNGPFVAFLINFCPLKCKRSSLRSQCWMRLFLWFSNTVIRILLFLKPQNSQDDFHIIPLFFWRVIGFASRVILKVILKELWDYDLWKKFDFPTRVQSSEFLKAIHMAEGDNTMLLLSFLLRLTHMSDLLHQPSSFRCFYMWIFHACTGYQMV